MRIFAGLILLIGLVLGSLPARAHEVRPALLQIEETSPQHFAIFWKQPVVGELALPLVPHISNGWLDTRAESIVADPGFLAMRWKVSDPHGTIDGARVRVDGLSESITDVLVRVTRLDGRSSTTLLKPSAPETTIRFADRGDLAVPAYFTLGVEHILTGIDHLAFVFGLLLLVGLNWRLVKAITAFTVAHSITLAASALGFVDVPPAPVEALVALSVLFLAVELARGAEGVTRRHPWVVAFIFGLLHGLAFAGALAETGLPPDAIPQALLLFNLGVEAGQLLFVAAALTAWIALRRLFPPQVPYPLLARAIPQYVLGAFAAFWVIERTAVIFA